MELTGEEQRRKAQYLLTHGVGKLFDDMLHKILMNEPRDPKDFLFTEFFQLSGLKSPRTMSPRHSPKNSPKAGDGITERRPSTSLRKSSFKAEPRGDADEPMRERKKSVRLLVGPCMSPDAKTVIPFELHNNPRGRTALRKAQREKFLEAYIRNNDTECTSNFKCAHLAMLAVGLSLFLDQVRAEEGNPEWPTSDPTEREFLPWTVTIEDIFFLLRLPFHYLRNAKMTLSELYDIAADFIQADFRLQGLVRPSVEHFDAAHQEEDGFNQKSEKKCDSEPGSPLASMANNNQVVTVNKLRTMIMEEVSHGEVIRVFHYDETADIKRDQGLEGDFAMDETAALESDSLNGDDPLTIAQTLGKSSKPFFSIAQTVNSVSQEVSMVECNLTDHAVTLSRSNVPISDLHAALSQVSNYSGRPRGYIEFSKVVHDASKKLTQIKVPDLTHIAPEVSSHLIAVAMGLHLVRREKRSSLIDISEVVGTLCLPLQLVCATDMSLQAVNDYATEYLKTREITDMKITNRIITSKSFKETDFDRALRTAGEAIQKSPKFKDRAFSPSTILACCFDVGVALKIKTGHLHWGIVAGYDAEKDRILMADVKPKKYQRTWCVPARDIFDAMVAVNGKGGYLTFARLDIAPQNPASLSKQRQSEAGDGILSRIRSNMNRGHFVQAHNPVVKSFDYPKSAYSITAIAIALSRLGYPKATVTDIVTNATFDINFLLSDHLCMGDVQRIALEYIAQRCNGEVAVSMTFLEQDHQGDFKLSKEEFETLLSSHFEEDNRPNPTTCTVLNFNPDIFALCSDSVGGHYGVITNIQHPFVTVSDCNPDTYYRAWKVRWQDLYSACTDMNPINTRAHGFLRFSRVTAPSVQPKGRIFAIAKSKTTHPFKPPLTVHIRGVAFALCELGFSCSMEDIFYDTFHLLREKVASRATTPNVTAGGGEKTSIVEKSHPWKISRFKLYMVKNTVDIGVCVSMANSYLQKQNSKHKAEIMLLDDKVATFSEAMTKASEPTCGYIVLIIYDARLVHNFSTTSRSSYSVGLVQHVDGESITLCDANPTKYGERWTKSLMTVFKACVDVKGLGVFRIGTWE